MLDCTWIQIIQRLVFVTCLFTVACVAGYFYYLWPDNQHAVTSRVPDARNAIARVLSVFLSAQGNDTVNNPSPLGTRSITESTSNHGVLLNASNPVKGVKYLSYQPPGNGWNNQRVALENAIVMAKLLNRTLLVHPMAPHDKGALYKAGAQPGYVAYNRLKQSDLVPLSVFLDLKLLSQLIPVQEVVTSHHQFYHDFGQLSWRNICHSMGFGYWMDRRPTTVEEIGMFKRQHFHASNAWKKKCPKEQKQTEGSTGAIVEYVSDYFNDPSEMLYFEQGTLFGIHIRFVHRDDAIAAQKWILDHLHYGPRVHSVVDVMAKRLGAQFNAIHVRRTDHPARKFPVDYWIRSLQSINCSTDVPLYVATDEKRKSYFDSFKEQRYKLVFAGDFHDLLQFRDVPHDAIEDVTGVYEQLLCEKANKFVPTPGSTFSVLILRNRNEIEVEDGLLMNSLHTFWIGHQMKET